MTSGRSQASLVSIILAAVSFAAFSVLIPAFIVVRLFRTRTSKLYDETWTLLSLGPLYNHYRHGSQLFACLFFATSLAYGITIGCGQKSGSVQAIMMLVIEVISALITSVWLPWGHGASMGLISFLFCVSRIIVAVLLVILTPSVCTVVMCSCGYLIDKHAGLYRESSRTVGRVCDPIYPCGCVPGILLDTHLQNCGGIHPYFRRCWIR